MTPLLQRSWAMGAMSPRPVVVSLSLTRLVTADEPDTVVKALSNSTVLVPAATVTLTENCPPRTDVANA